MSRFPFYTSVLFLILVTTLNFSAARSSTPDPECTRGLLSCGACCPMSCGVCRQWRCDERSRQARTNCCPVSIRANPSSCTTSGPPCSLPVITTGTPRRDPRCATGITRRGACCPKSCITCGGPLCVLRSRRICTMCCPTAISRTAPSCARSGPPCIIESAAKPTPSNSPSPSPKPDVRSTLTGSWELAKKLPSSSPVVRHEACAVMVNGLVVLLGGRGANKLVSIYDPQTAVWINRSGPGPGIQLHHTQCVVADGKIWAVSSWGGRFPFETNNDLIYIYDVAADKWATRKGLPARRLRGGAAAVLRGPWIYVIGGNIGGHGSHATAHGWMDRYNYRSNTWQTNLPSLPKGAERDHFGGALVKDQLCIGGGRDSGKSPFFNAVVNSTYCYNFGTKKWVEKDKFPAPRAGAMTGATCDGKMMIAGGEGAGIAYNRVDVFDGTTWTQAPSMKRGRHGSGLAIARCSCGQIFIPSGSPTQGGSPELDSTEQYIPKGGPTICTRY